MTDASGEPGIVGIAGTATSRSKPKRPVVRRRTPRRTICVEIAPLERARNSSSRPLPTALPLKTSTGTGVGSGTIGRAQPTDVPLPIREPDGQPSGALACSSLARSQAANFVQFDLPGGNLKRMRRTGLGCDPSGLANVTPVPRPMFQAPSLPCCSRLTTDVSVAAGAAEAAGANAAKAAA